MPHDCVMRYWPDSFRALYGGVPENYCVIDTETTGFRHDRDVITEWGHVLVQGGEVVDTLSLVVDWTDHPIVQDHWLRGQLAAVQQAMAMKGKPYHVTYARMKECGQKPDKALAFIRDFTRTLLDKGVLFVAHNGAFDERMLSGNFYGFNVARGFSFGDNGLFDTDAVEKASQLLDNPRMYPKPGDTLRSYFHRVRYTRAAGIKSSLDQHCYPKYNLARHGVAQAALHGALADAYCTHLLLQEYLAASLGPPLPPVAAPQARDWQKPDARPAPPPAGRRVRGQRSY